MLAKASLSLLNLFCVRLSKMHPVLMLHRVAPTPHPYLQERLHHEDLAMIRRRLDDLNENQKLQMDALLGDGPLISSRTDILTPRSDDDKEN